MTEQTEQACVWPFAECYKEKYGGLPPSQQREAVKRLTGRRRNPLTEEQVREPSTEVEAVLTAVNAAYLNKKQRSKQASATKRMIDRAQPGNVEAEPAAEADAVADDVATLSVAEIVAEEPAPTPEPTPTPEPPAVKRSAPIPIPGAVAKPVPVARAPAATPMPAPMPALALPALAQPPKPAAQKSGLSAMLKR